MPENTLQPIILIDDQPIFGDKDRPDRLDVLAFAKALAGVALGTEGPFNIGVYGGWGVGKTSMLRHVKSLIEKEAKPEVVTVWFNPWQFECEEHPLFPLTAAIVRALDDHLKAHSAANAAAQGWLASVHRNLRAIAYASSFELSAGIAKWKVDAAKGIDREEALRPPKDLFEDEIKYQAAFSALERCSGALTDTARIVVFIDDLDRCQPKNALKLLESIKLALGQKGFIFFLAVDNAIIEGYLTHSYKQELDLATASDGQTEAPYRDLAARYLHKLVQMDFPLPSHIPARFNAYLSELTEADVADPAQRAELVTILRLGAAANPRSAVRQINRLRVQYNLWKLMDMGVPDGVTEAQIPLLMAFSNVLLDRLGPRPFEQLVDDEAACQALADQRPPQEEDTEAPLEAAAKQLIEPLRKEHKALEPLFTGNIAQLWLANKDLRQAIHTFFQKTEAISEETEDQQTIVDRALRNALKLAPEAPTPEQKRKEVTRLDLSGQSDFSDAGIELLKGLTSLQWLWLNSTQVTDAGLAHLAALTSLQWLWLDGTQVTDAGVAHLAALTGLRRLYLDGTQVSDAGLAHLAALTRLRQLVLDGTQITDAGLSHLAALTSLRELSLNRTQVTDAGLAQLAALTGLPWLSLSRTQVTDAGVAHLAALTGLQWLILDDTQVTDAGVAHLADLTNLQSLWLSGTQVSDAGVEALRKELPKCSIHR